MKFLNADLIAAGLSPFSPEMATMKAGRLMLQGIMESANARENFAFETTLSGLSYVQHIRKWRKVGYHVTLFFLSLNSVDLAIKRVAYRVQQGGHNISEEVIRRRFKVGFNNFEQYYKPIVDVWTLYDNSSDEPKLIDCGESDG